MSTGIDPEIYAGNIVKPYELLNKFTPEIRAEFLGLIALLAELEFLENDARTPEKR